MLRLALRQALTQSALLPFNSKVKLDLRSHGAISWLTQGWCPKCIASFQPAPLISFVLMSQQLIVGDRNSCRCDPAPAANIPGTPGAPGSNGAAGDPGSNAWASLTDPFTMPAFGGNGVASLDHTDWLAPGEPVWIEGIGTLLVVSIAGLDATLQNLADGAGAYPGNAAPGTIAATTLRVTPTGFQGQSGALSGVAGGDLQGNYPNPNLINTGTPGTYGDSTHVPVITTDTAGRVTTATPTAIAFPNLAALGGVPTGLATAGGLTVSATDKVLGRSSPGAGAVEEIACTATGRSVLAAASVTAERTLLGIGVLSVVTKTSGYVATTADDVVLVDATTGSIIIDLPAVASAIGHRMSVKKIDATANTVTVRGHLAEVIDGSNTQVLSSQWTSIDFVPNGSGTAWFII